jgi:hypothetical protein
MRQPAGQRPFTRDRLVRALHLLGNAGLAERALLEPARGVGRRPDRASVRATEAVARYLRSHRREAQERSVLARR